tara:strand:+ start:338 stop:580 length:243 start_codon:yes stop_codon:yes gene_type:complete
MKQILTALFVITASVATAGGEGRYLTAILDDKTVVVTDTKLGKVRLCRFTYYAPKDRQLQANSEYTQSNDPCDLWRDVTK